MKRTDEHLLTEGIGWACYVQFVFYDEKRMGRDSFVHRHVGFCVGYIQLTYLELSFIPIEHFGSIPIRSLSNQLQQYSIIISMPYKCTI